MPKTKSNAPKNDKDISTWSWLEFNEVLKRKPGYDEAMTLLKKEKLGKKRKNICIRLASYAGEQYKRELVEKIKKELE